MPSAAPPRIRRDVVSYVRRSARMNPSQQRAWDGLRERWVVELPAGERETSVAGHARLDPLTAFGRPGPLLVEIGSGAGEVVAAVAARRPEANLLAFEVFEPAVASTLSRLERTGVDNVRLVVADGSQAIATALPEGSITELWTFFPDPWHKSRHHKRRLVNPGFAAVVAEHAAAVLAAEPGLVPLHDGTAPRWAERPLTRYEQRGIAAGRTITDLAWRRP
jgi:tRNA (guanine-N7-)-methyltransferase